MNPSHSDEPPSKSRRKREAAAVLDLARRLTVLPQATLDRLPVPDDALETLQLARRTRHHGARKRETQHLAKLLRRSDALDALRGAVEALDHASRQGDAHFHALEQWRDRLIDQGNDAINELIASCRDADRQKLRQLVSKARTERDAQKPPAASRRLFRYLRELFGETPL